MHVEFSYVAVKPIRVEHPVGSGTIVIYQPGDVIPAADWGRAADNLVELGKAAMLAVNVPDGNEPELGETATAVSSTLEPHWDQSTVDEKQAALHVTQLAAEQEVYFPIAGSGGWFTLSDGSKVRGEENAVKAQTALGG